MAEYRYGIICDKYPTAGKARAIKVNLDTFSLDSSLEIDYDGYGNTCTIVSGDYLYFAHDIAGGTYKVIKIALATMTKEAEIILDDDDPLSMAVRDGFLYIGGFDSVISKINLSTFAFDNKITVGSTGHYGMVVSGTTLYTASQQHAYKIDLATFTETGHCDLSGPGIDFRACTIDATYLYLGGWDDSVIFRIDIATFTWNPVTGWALTTEAEITAVGISGNYLYATTLDGSPDLMKVDLTTFTETDTLNVLYYDARDLFIKDGYLYMAMFFLGGTPVVEKVDLATLTEDDTLQILGYANYGIWHLAGIPLPIIAPTVTTDPASALAANHATPNGTLDDAGGEACECGFEWGLTDAYGLTTPTDSKVTGDTFSQIIRGLFPDTVYHFRAFATNSAGTGYGADRSFTTAPIFNRGFALSREEL